MPLYERVASALIGSPLQAPAERLRWMMGARERRRHPELGEIHLEDERVETLIARTVTDGMNCLDVGCHLGSVTQKLVRLSPTGKHLAVEPLPYKAAWLRRKFPTVDIQQVAVGDEECTLDFFYNPKQSGFSGLKAGKPDAGVQKLAVQCRRLDNLVPADRKIGFIKIDVEGAEYAALRGAKRIIADGQPLILFECTRSNLRSFNRTAAEMFGLFNDEFGYRVYLIKSWLAGAAPLTLDELEQSMNFPFQAFNYVAAPAARKA